LAKPVPPQYCLPSSQTDNGRDPSINKKNVGSQMAQLNELRRLESRTSRNAIKSRQAINPGSAME
jgi:hypothetical protein